MDERTASKVKERKTALERTSSSFETPPAAAP